jgi:ketosteroid isomerase-like protein
MSQENVEIIRAAIDAINRGDLEGVLKDADPDFEFDLSRAVGPVQGVFKLDQTRGLLEEFFGMWEAVRWEIDELREVGDHVAASTTNYLRGRDGIEITARTPWVWTFRDGSIVRQCGYQEWQEALEAVGLSEQAMSQESVELVRSIYAAWERGDFSSTEWAHPNIEFVSPDSLALPGGVTGLAAMAEVWRDWLSTWEHYGVKAEEYRELDDERVLVLVKFLGRGKTSGLELGQVRSKEANLFHVHAGKVTRLVLYADRERAFADLGLSEQDAHAES